MSQNPGKPDDVPAPSSDDRQPYEPPSIECEDLFEVLALSCAKINTNFNCRILFKTS